MNNTTSFPAFVVRKDADGRITARVERLTIDELPPGEVLIRVAYSSLNYKDALASQGHPGVVRTFPHVPGIDCAGTVEESTSPDYRPGDQVIITGYDLGSGHWGGYAEFVRVPADWIVPLPSGLTLRETMIYGTAGFTAAQCVAAIIARGIEPSRGPVVVTGSTGGVGSIAVAILAKLGYEVEAVTGKREHHDWLRKLGRPHDSQSRRCVGRQRPPPAPLALGSSCRHCRRKTTCDDPSLDAASRLRCRLRPGRRNRTPLTIYPFILRGVTLAGIDSANCPRPERLEMWRKLAGPWHIAQLESLADEITLDELPDRIQKILAGQIVGRTVVVPRSK